MIKIIITILIACFSIPFLLFFLQHKMIYYPSKYSNFYKKIMDKVVYIKYNTSQGEQTAFYYSLNNNNKASRTWIMFGGNGSLALDWMDLIELYDNTNDGFLMIDYPGYGNSNGYASPDTILESSKKAVSALCEHFNIDELSLLNDLNIIGHSLGAAAALQLAVYFPVKSIILISPFTSLLDMAKRVVGIPLCYVLIHRFDNILFLKKIEQKDNKPSVLIIHGAVDEVVPVDMSQKLNKEFSSFVKYIEFPYGDHNMIINIAKHEIFKEMQKTAK